MIPAAETASLADVRSKRPDRALQAGEAETVTTDYIPFNRPYATGNELVYAAEAQRNRLVLMGLMTTAGWDFYRNEWWHYQLFDARRFPLVCDADLPRPMM